MLRNRDILFCMAVAAAVTVAASAVCFAVDTAAGVLCMAACACLCVAFILFTRRRYRRIAELSDYLKRLSRGEKALDIRDNAEGELSILKNELYKVTAALGSQAGELARDKRELANVLADISHQLKTPLTALGVMADLLDDGDLPPEKRRDFLENMRTGLNRMEWLVLALLKQARLDADAVALRRESIPLSALAQRALAPLAIPIELREQTVSVDGGDTDVICDPDWTAEALSNILKNAVENTPAGGHIRVSYGRNPLYAFISVRDGGPGIDKSDLPHLFERFYRGRGANPESAGIGLAMSLAIMRRQSGDIEAASDGGGVFTLKFYIRLQSDKTVTGKVTGESHGDGKIPLR